MSEETIIRVPRRGPSRAEEVRGLVEDGVSSFLDIPYAEPPAGENRFREARRVTHSLIARGRVVDRRHRLR